MLFGLNKKTEQVGGLIKHLGIQEFYFSLTPEERSTLKRYYDSRMSASIEKKPLSKPSTFNTGNLITSETRLSYFGSTIGWAENEKRYDITEKLIREGNKYINEDLIDAHFFLQAAGECYYKQRETRLDALDLCITYCEQDIALFEQYKVPFIKDLGTLPRLTTFSRLAIIYEKQGRYEDALRICRLACENNLKDGTKGGFEGRINKIEKKLSSEK